MQPFDSKTARRSHVIAAASLILAAWCMALPDSAEAKGRRSGSSSKTSNSHSQHASDEGGKSVNINLRTGNSSSSNEQQQQAAAAATAAGAALLAANAQARSQEDAAKAASDYQARKAEYEREKAAKAAATGAAPVGAKPAGAEENDRLKAAFASVSGVPVGGGGQVFKVVDAQGRITFTDAPPNRPDIKVTQGIGRQTLGAAAADSPFRNLPAGLASVASRFPVVLFSGNGCAPCDQARSLLNARGIPFQERTVRTNADIEALARMSGGDASLPMTMIAGQTLRGFSDIELTSTLDAAGYPATSALPTGFRNPTPTPLVTVDRSAAAPNTTANAAAGANSDGVAFSNARANASLSPEEQAQQAARAAAQREAAAAQAANPAGIRF